MITFNVIKEQHGWAIWIGGRTTTPFWSRNLAIREANCLADAIRRHGERAEVYVSGTDADEPPTRIASLRSYRTMRADACGGCSDMVGGQIW